MREQPLTMMMTCSSGAWPLEEMRTFTLGAAMCDILMQPFTMMTRDKKKPNVLCRRPIRSPTSCVEDPSEAQRPV
jgi:hypothetical protein